MAIGPRSLAYAMSKAPERAVGAVVFDEEGRVLLVQRGRPPLQGSWSLPGGRLEAGETPRAAIEREVREETGLTVRAERLVVTVVIDEEGFSYEIEDWLCVLAGETTEATARAGDDALDVRWAELRELEGLGVRALAIGVIERGYGLVKREVEAGVAG